MEADNGNDIAQYLIGYLFYSGQGVSKDYWKAQEWFLKAARQMKPTAMYYIGKMISEGVVGSRNDQEAAEWFFQVASLGDINAHLF